MTLAKKIVATVALILGATRAASPAPADNHMPVSPDGSQSTVVVPLDSHAG
ncbi:hypothetical protein LT493_27415 [Streptomyces tricolor]|nr:hypothetical protein [Streptomyces tricolor]